MDRMDRMGIKGEEEWGFCWSSSESSIGAPWSPSFRSSGGSQMWHPPVDRKEGDPGSSCFRDPLPGSKNFREGGPGTHCLTHNYRKSCDFWDGASNSSEYIKGEEFWKAHYYTLAPRQVYVNCMLTACQLHATINCTPTSCQLHVNCMSTSRRD